MTMVEPSLVLTWSEIEASRVYRELQPTDQANVRGHFQAASQTASVESSTALSLTGYIKYLQSVAPSMGDGSKRTFYRLFLEDRSSWENEQRKNFPPHASSECPELVPPGASELRSNLIKQAEEEDDITEAVVADFLDLSDQVLRETEELLCVDSEFIFEATFGIHLTAAETAMNQGETDVGVFHASHAAAYAMGVLDENPFELARIAAATQTLKKLGDYSLIDDRCRNVKMGRKKVACYDRTVRDFQRHEISHPAHRAVAKLGALAVVGHLSGFWTLKQLAQSGRR